MITIRIRHQSFTFPVRYVPGHVLSESEATALNGLLAENVRNNVDQWVIRELDGDGGLSPITHAALQVRIAEYAGHYQFGRGRIALAGQPGPGALEAEIERLARTAVNEWAQSRGIPIDSALADYQFKSIFMETKTREQAQQNLAARAKAAASALADL